MPKYDFATIASNFIVALNIYFKQVILLYTNLFQAFPTKHYFWVLFIGILSLLCACEHKPAASDVATQGLKSENRPVSKDSLIKIWFGRNRNETDTAMLSVGKSLQTIYSSNNPDSLPVISRDMEQSGIATSNPKWVAQARYGLGNYYFNTGKPDSAMANYRAAVQVLNGSDTALICKIYLNQSAAFSAINQPDSSHAYLLKALPLAQQTNSKLVLAGIYCDLGGEAQNKGDLMEALNYFSQSLEYGGSEDSLIVYLNLGLIFQSLGLDQEAETNYLQAVNIAEKAPNFNSRIHSYLAMMEVAPNLAEIQSWFDKGVRLSDSLNVPLLKMLLLRNAGMAYLNSLQLDKAAQYLTASIALAKEVGENETGILSLQLQWAKLEHARGNYQRSLQQCLGTQDLCRELGNTQGLRLLTELLSKNYEALGQPAKALQFLHEHNKIAAEENSNKQLKSVLSAYLKDKSKNEVLGLQKDKAYAEAITREEQEKARLSYWVFGLVSLFLAGIAAFYFFFYRQKNRLAAELALANSALSAEKAKLQQSNAKLYRFSRIISHDILSNLDLILSTGNVLVGNNPQPKRLSEYYHMAQQTSRQLKTYCLGLLKESQPAPSDASVELRTDPIPVLNEVLTRFASRLKAQHFSVTIDAIAPTRLPVGTIEQLFQNLISNALLHVTGVAEPRLHFGADKDAEGRDLWVIEDNGPGVRPEQFEAIFEGKKDPSSPHISSGQGVGLSLTRANLRDYGADIRVETRKGGGARFVVVLP